MNIFYTEVDKNLQEELNARGQTGFQNRTSNAIDFMIGKIANVQITAYQGNSAKSGKVLNPQSVLGGANVQTGRYLPSGPDGYLTDKIITRDEISFYDEQTITSNAAAQLAGQKYDPNAKLGNAYLKNTILSDNSRRTGPYITGVDVTLGDHSMGLLNKATINISIPNVSRDLDDIEEVWFRPGRYVGIDIVHPDSALVSRDNFRGAGQLTSKTLPNRDRIKELYPEWDVDEFLNEISKLNMFRFEGLITSFDFSYTADGTVDATLSLTGTSNVYTDISMYLSGDQKKQKPSTPGATTENFVIQPVIKTTPAVAGEEATNEKVELWEVLQDRVDVIVDKFKNSNDSTKKFTQFLLPFQLTNYTPATDHFLLVGEQYLPKIQQDQIPEAKNEYKYAGAIKTNLIKLSDFYYNAKQSVLINSSSLAPRAAALSTPASGSAPAATVSVTELSNRISNTSWIPVFSTDNDISTFESLVSIFDSNKLITAAEKTRFDKDFARAKKEKDAEQKRVDQQNVERSKFINNFNNGESQTNYNRYITLGALIHVINTYIATNITGSVQFAKIIHTDELNFSNYYPSLVSTNPEEVLFLPKDPSKFDDMNSYNASLASTLDGTSLVYYGDVVNQIYKYGLTEESLFELGWQEWPGVYSQQNGKGKMYPSRIFINLETIQQIIEPLTKIKNAFTIKTFIQKISQVVSRCSGNAIDLKLVTYPDDPKKLMLADTKYLKSVSETVVPYSIPMFANHPNGSIVREFSFKAKLPENVKNLSYVLNQGDAVTEEQIAPYMNFMYNAKSPAQINQVISAYRNKFTENLKRLQLAKTNYALSPGVNERKQALYKAVTDYVKFPTDDIRTSQQISAPIFPFEVEFTIDGINGLRYGDVLTFEALPYKYRVNTVFSIISITHTISTEGDWSTNVRCIMRPSIE